MKRLLGISALTVALASLAPPATAGATPPIEGEQTAHANAIKRHAKMGALLTIGIGVYALLTSRKKQRTAP